MTHELVEKAHKRRTYDDADFHWVSVEAHCRDDRCPLQGLKLSGRPEDVERAIYLMKIDHNKTLALPPLTEVRI